MFNNILSHTMLAGLQSIKRPSSAVGRARAPVGDDRRRRSKF